MLTAIRLQTTNHIVLFFRCTVKNTFIFLCFLRICLIAWAFMQLLRFRCKLLDKKNVAITYFLIEASFVLFCPAGACGEAWTIHNAIKSYQYCDLYFLISRQKVSTCCFPPLPLCFTTHVCFFGVFFSVSSFSTLLCLRFLHLILGLFLGAACQFFFSTSAQTARAALVQQFLLKRNRCHNASLAHNVNRNLHCQWKPVKAASLSARLFAIITLTCPNEVACNIMMLT